MIRAYSLAFAQLLDPRLMRIVLVSLVLTIAIYIAMLFGLIWGLEHTTLASTAWINTLARWGTGLGAALMAMLLFPGVVTAVMALWQDRIADAVEARHYPGLPPARAVPIAEVLGASLRLLALTVILNLAMLPIYGVLLFLPPMNLVAFAVVNGLLLGREYFDAAGLRHVSPDALAVLRREARGRIWMAGTVAALVLSIPILNLVGPVLGTAAFVHLFQDIARRARSRANHA